MRAVIELYPKIRYILFIKGEAQLKESIEIKGLSALIVEQEYQTWTVMRAPDGINFKLRQGCLLLEIPLVFSLPCRISAVLLIT